MTEPRIEAPSMEVHNLGCQCYPHVAEDDALACIADIALKEYRAERRRVEQEATALDVERLARALEAAGIGTFAWDSASAAENAKHVAAEYARLRGEDER